MKLSSSTWVGTLVSANSKIYCNIHLLRRSLQLLLCVQLCPTLCNPEVYSPPGSSVHGILQARTLEWVDMTSSRGSSQPRDWTCISYVSCTDRQVLCHRTTWDTLWRSQDPALSQLYCFLIVPLLFLHSYPSLIRSNLPFWTQGRSKKLKPFFSQARNWGTQKGFCTQEGPQFLLSSNPSFIFDIPQSWGEQVLDREEITFWIDKLVIKSAEEFSFMGIQFQSPKQFQLSPNLSGDRVMSTPPTFFCNRV